MRLCKSRKEVEFLTNYLSCPITVHMCVLGQHDHGRVEHKPKFVKLKAGQIPDKIKLSCQLFAAL